MANVITGAKAYIKVSGNVIAFASGVSVQHENRLEEIPQLDSLEVAEYAENGHRCSVTVQFVKLASDANFGGVALTNSANAFGFDPQNDLKEILLQPEVIIEIVDSVPVYSGKDIVDFQEKGIYTAFGCKFDSGSGQLNARGVWEGSWNFKCRRGTGI